MGQLNKTEQDFRDKLNGREITPSAGAWDRLDAMLTVAEEKKSKRGFGWLYIAASICGFLLIGTVFLSQTEEAVDKGRPVVFESQTPETIQSNEATIVPAATNPDAIAAADHPKKPNKNNNHQSKSSNPSQSPQSNQSQTIINQNPVEAIDQIPDNKLIASANPIPQKDRPVSVNVDELLASAQSASAHPKTSVKINAKNLLSEVDKDVNVSFRDKMFRRAGEVATAVANRNNE